MEYPDDLLHLPKCAIHNRANTVANVVRPSDYSFLVHVQLKEKKNSRHIQYFILYCNKAGILFRAYQMNLFIEMIHLN